MENRLITVKEAMEYLHISRPTTMRMMDEIGATRRIGRKVLFDKVVIDKWIEENEAVHSRSAK